MLLVLLEGHKSFRSFWRDFQNQNMHHKANELSIPVQKDMLCDSVEATVGRCKSCKKYLFKFR